MIYHYYFIVLTGQVSCHCSEAKVISSREIYITDYKTWLPRWALVKVVHHL